MEFKDAIDKINNSTIMYNSAVADFNLALSIEIQRAVANLSVQFDNIPSLLEDRCDELEQKYENSSTMIATLPDTVQPAGSLFCLRR